MGDIQLYPPSRAHNPTLSDTNTYKQEKEAAQAAEEIAVLKKVTPRSRADFGDATLQGRFYIKRLSI